MSVAVNSWVLKGKRDINTVMRTEFCRETVFAMSCDRRKALQPTAEECEVLQGFSPQDSSPVPLSRVVKASDVLPTFAASYRPLTQHERLIGLAHP